MVAKLGKPFILLKIAITILRELKPKIINISALLGFIPKGAVVDLLFVPPTEPVGHSIHIMNK